MAFVVPNRLAQDPERGTEEEAGDDATNNDVGPVRDELRKMPRSAIGAQRRELVQVSLHDVLRGQRARVGRIDLHLNRRVSDVELLAKAFGDFRYEGVAWVAMRHDNMSS